MTIQQAIDLAIQHHQAGRLPPAEKLYRQVLSEHPNHPEALRRLGTLAAQVNRPGDAIELLRRSLAAKPDSAEAWLDLGNIFQATGNLPDAIDAFRRVTSLMPNFAGGHCNLGNALQASGQSEAAVAACRRAIQLKPDLAEAHSNLGNALHGIGKGDAAIAAYERAISLKPAFPTAHFNLGNAWLTKKNVDSAIACFHRAISLQPGLAQAHFNLAGALQMNGQTDAAIGCYQQVVAMNPDDFTAHLELGRLLHARGRIDEAIAALMGARTIRPADPFVHNDLGVALQARCRIHDAVASYRQHLAIRPDDPFGNNNLGAALLELFEAEAAVACFQRALAINPDYWEAHSNLGTAWKDLGRLDESVASFRRSLSIAPKSAVVHSKLAYTLNFHINDDSASIGEECRRWNQQHARPLKRFIQAHANDRDPDRRLRIGYVSPDFRNQSECYFVVPLLESHDHSLFEIHCYASVAAPDAITHRQRRATDVWHDVLGLTDAELAERIRQDRIDILVDLTMHMSANRLLTMARKPAPVQVCWLAYPGTTGLEAIDYRITDAFMDPPDVPTPFYSETSVRMPDCWVCFDPLAEASPAALRDASWSGPVCFGSLNNPCKINEPTLRIWAEILKAVPGSRLLLLAGSTLQRHDIRRVFELAGVDAVGVEFVGYAPRAEYLRLYDRIDICLDPLPYNGITTTCDALWMGVPVVSMTGQTAAGRAGLAMLTCAGLAELVARTPDEYVRVVAELANDRPRLAHLRSTLRQTVESSPLMNRVKFTRDLEAAYRQMWSALPR